MATDTFVIDLKQVEKRYRRRVHALRGVDMKVHRGEVFGLLGPNGAGKTTLVKIMMTIVKPTRAQGTGIGCADRPQTCAAARGIPARTGAAAPVPDRQAGD